VKTFWLSFGGGVNSTALLVLLVEKQLPQYQPWRIVFADTYDEKDETYQYIDGVIRPYLRRHGVVLETVCDDEGVLQRWERLKVTGSRTLRLCTTRAKIEPIQWHIDAHGESHDEHLIGIDAGEPHRAKPHYPGQRAKNYPLVELGHDREACVRIIQTAGLPVPIKSGCWHCPFLRVGEILRLATEEPDKMKRIYSLELIATETHGVDTLGRPRTQWGDKPAREWAKRACEENSSGPLFQEIDPDPPCECYDGA
jgi:phosphoadenosine phosphosulfate reductase family protein